MAIRIRIAAGATERISLVYSPLLEAALSLHVLIDPKHHSLHHAWVREMRGLPTGLKKAISSFAFCFRGYMPSVLTPGPTGEFPNFQDDLDRLRSIPLDVVRFEFTRPYYGGALPRTPTALDDPAVRDEVLMRAANGDPAGAELVALAFDDPALLLRKFARLLADYWEIAFASQWHRIEPLLADAVAEAGIALAARGVYGLLEGIGGDLKVDPLGEQVWLERDHEHDLEISGDDRLVMIPSVYIWPHLRIGCDVPKSPGILYPAPALGRQARGRLAPADLLRVLKALGDDTRLRAIRLIAQQPRSTQELAPMVGVTEAALSKHLRLLADAGILVARRDGYYVLYSLVADQVVGVADGLRDYLSLSDSLT
ncbi:MAG: ArsR/SmtB family transcription factor [Acidimicrobiales bacterium]